MIKALLESWKDPARRGFWFAVLYFGGIVISAWYLFTLRSDLTYDGGVVDNVLATKVYLKLYIVLGFTLAFGVTAINLILKHKKEVVVFLERREERQMQQNTSSTSGDDISVETFKKGLEQSKGQEAQSGLNQLCKILQAGQGALYVSEMEQGKRLLRLKGNYALVLGESETIEFEYGEGLIGQAATSGVSLYLDEIPEGYVNIVSGLGSAQPRYLFVMPLKTGNEVKGVVEVATFVSLSESVRKKAEEMASVLAEKLSKK